MTELDHLQAAVLKDLGKMVIAGAGIIVLLALLLWGLVTSAEAFDHHFSCSRDASAFGLEERPSRQMVSGGDETFCVRGV
jgi:hypothetical protein